MPTLREKDLCQSIVSVFETGQAKGNPSAVAILSDGAGLSYGVHQATDRSDALDRILLRYLDIGGTRVADATEVLRLVEADATTRYTSLRSAPPNVQRAAELLAELGKDPVMVAAQIDVFDADYWNPAVAQAKEMGVERPLTIAVLYDTAIQSGIGGIANIRKRFPEVPPSRGGDEMRWTVAYVKARRAWLASHSNPLVRRTVYRMDAFLQLIAESNWWLLPPFTVRGVIVQ